MVLGTLTASLTVRLSHIQVYRALWGIWLDMTRVELSKRTVKASDLTINYGSCIALGEWPTMWRKGEWTPVFKTVQVTINKIFEQLLSKQLGYGFNENSVTH